MCSRQNHRGKNQTQLTKINKNKNTLSNTYSTVKYRKYEPGHAYSVAEP
jgi:hypothetical protein